MLASLSVRFWIDFKILMITFKACLWLAPDYITDLSTPYGPECSLRSSSRGLLVIPRSRLKIRGERAFGVRAPRLWNDLPEEIRQASSVSAFKSPLKMRFFRIAFSWIGYSSVFTLLVFTVFYASLVIITVVLLFITYLLISLVFMSL